jgi:type IV pilus assembly protein PilE
MVNKREKSDMKRQASKKGFTLVELMIVVGIVAILVALALPNYTRYVRKANRGEAQQLLMNWANNQEIWRANNTEYATKAQLPVPQHDRYTFDMPVDPTATTFNLTATPDNDQAKDEERGELCGAEANKPLSLNQSGTKGPQYGGVTYCWGN